MTFRLGLIKEQISIFWEPACQGESQSIPDLAQGRDFSRVLKTRIPYSFPSSSF